MVPERAVWVFNTPNRSFPGGIFTTPELADEWIAVHRLTGVLTAYPLDQGALDWASTQGCTNLRAEKLEQKRLNPMFVGGFTTASQKHYHYENGRRI